LLSEEFAELYDHYLIETANLAHEELSRAVSSWSGRDYWTAYAPEDASSAIPNPVYLSKSRIKRPEQILDKIRRLPDDFPDGVTEPSIRRMNDIVGARVIVFFRSHLSMIDQEIRSGDLFVTPKDKLPKAYVPEHVITACGLDPDTFRVRERKFSGYSSLHYIVRPASLGDVDIWCELQVRTLAEELWAEVEHQLGYKPDKRTELSVKRQFKVLSEHLSAVDSHLDFLYQELQYFQSESQPESSDPLNAENLPSVLAEFNLRVAQRELGAMLSILEDHGVATVGDLLDRLEGGAHETILQQLTIVGLAPDAFGVVANAAFLRPHPSKNEIERQVRVMAQMSSRRRGRPKEL
jgi:putative GTP pyrophosphokinase